MRYFYSYKTDIGDICLAEENGAIINLIFINPAGERKREADERTARMIIGDVSEEKETALIGKAHEQLQEYLAGERREFNLPLMPKGTEFQKKVWSALMEIPYGETRTYKDVAVRIGNDKACRAVGLANNRNPISVFVPCHRVIGSTGKLVGYGGGLEIKSKLLDLERSRS